MTAPGSSGLGRASIRASVIAGSLSTHHSTMVPRSWASAAQLVNESGSSGDAPDTTVNSCATLGGHRMRQPAPAMDENAGTTVHGTPARRPQFS